MRKTFWSVVCIAASTMPLAAQEWQVLGGIEAVSNYVSNGVTQSNGNPAIQPWVEINNAHFYAGLWASNVDFGNSDDYELDIYLGYRRSFANDLFIDLGYARYLYDGTGDCCGELKVTAAYPIHDRVGLLGYVAYNPESDEWNRRATLAYKVNDKISLSGTYGYSDFNQHDYWDVGASFPLTDTVAMDVRYQGSEAGDEGVVVGVSWSASQVSMAQLFLAPFRR
ncbi:TorF family putative porin [Aliisedimentitalea scapharcae]|uniref:TorF family putative porin n=1 Tax=Aliisedimentitalea scapharcae TaxID=1524259 RepID=A0ABZ2Y1X8_9RHOB|nr:TorF family putative porin [Rhodobacteraceae bacterium M382]